jgi:hypothetical protein
VKLFMVSPLAVWSGAGISIGPGTGNAKLIGDRHYRFVLLRGQSYGYCKVAAPASTTAIGLTWTAGPSGMPLTGYYVFSRNDAFQLEQGGHLRRDFIYRPLRHAGDYLLLCRRRVRPGRQRFADLRGSIGHHTGAALATSQRALRRRPPSG